jgi:hypothetical protein
MPSSAGLDVILSVVTCCIYYIYLQYKWGKLVDSARRRYDLMPRDDSALFVVLAFFNLSVVNYCIIQGQLNEDLGPVANSVPPSMSNYESYPYTTVSLDKEDDRNN